MPVLWVKVLQIYRKILHFTYKRYFNHSVAVALAGVWQGEMVRLTCGSGEIILYLQKLIFYEYAKNYS